MSTKLWSGARRSNWLAMNAPAPWCGEVPRSSIPGNAGLPPEIQYGIMLSLDKDTPQNTYDQANGGHRVQLQQASGDPMGTPVGATRCVKMWIVIDPVWAQNASAWQIIWQSKQDGGGTPGIDLQYRNGRLMLTDRTDTEKAGFALAHSTPVEIWVHHKLSSNGFADLYKDGVRIGGFVGDTNGAGTTKPIYPCLDIYTSDAIARLGGTRKVYFMDYGNWDGLPDASGPVEPPPAPGDTGKPVVTMTAPTTGQWGMVEFIVNADDPSGIPSLVVGINGTALKQTFADPSFPKSVTFDITNVAPGQYYAWAAAKDPVGNEGTANALFTISVPPVEPPPPADQVIEYVENTRADFAALDDGIAAVEASLAALKATAQGGEARATPAY